MSERQPLIRPGSPNEIWSVDFVFDRIASGRALKCLVIVDDATHEAIAIVVEHSMGGNHLARVLDGICSLRGRPAVIRSDNDLSSKSIRPPGQTHPSPTGAAIEHTSQRYRVAPASDLPR